MLLYWLSATAKKISLSISTASFSVYKYKLGLYTENCMIKVISTTSRKSAEMK